MAVSVEEVRRIAALARLRLEESEVERLARDLTDILGHVEALAEAVGESAPAGDESPEAGSPPGSEPTPLRRDEPGPDPLAEVPARFAAEFRDGFFLVPGREDESGTGA